ncbi:hypothetical protein FGO68_gene1345 [Halteria grandinella]|uniref:WDR59/RTC1-like RING zinc finger domain-containing protein n=1 Tax=Halteria grandinella TaxID=5974 RepID=A0A8J8NAS4_HALGN|nr:hypothetical protein FGO68_gene1345 [Halteria grandinella]
MHSKARGQSVQPFSQDPEATYLVKFGKQSPPKKVAIQKDKRVGWHQSGQPIQQQSKWVHEVMVKTVLETISHYADNGDIQIAAFITMIFYDFLSPIKSYESFISRIIISYLQLLKTLQLNSHITEVIKYGPPVDDIDKKFKPQQSYVISVDCPFCKSKEELGKGLLCTNEKCQKIASRCSICQLPVTGLYTWCQGCSHGGHFKHLFKWFKVNNMCPVAGCGHQCKERQEEGMMVQSQRE